MTEVLLAARRAIPNTEVQFFDASKQIRNAERGHLRLKNVRINIKLFARLVAAVVRRRPSIVWLPLAQNTTGFLRDSLYVIAVSLLGARPVLHFFGGAFQRFYERRSTVMRWYVRQILSHSAAVIAISDEIAGQFRLISPEIQTHVVRNGLLRTRYEGLMPRKRQGETIEIVFLGHVSHAKGALDLIRAAALMHARAPFHIRLAGEMIDNDTNTDFLSSRPEARVSAPELIRELGLSNVVEVLGPVSDNRSTELLRNADVFVLPSYSEGLSIAVLEAMAAGLALVLTPVGATRAFVKHDVNCLFVTPGDVAALAIALATLVDSPSLRDTMGKRNRVLIADSLLEEHVASDMRDALAAIARG
jgi:glycosyltransferase involved in cell wall biosynthesis